MPVHSETLSAYILELYDAHTIEKRFFVYEKYLKRLGFSAAVYSFVPRIQWELMIENPYIFLHTSDFPMTFLAEYTEKRFDRKDFTVRQILEEDLSIKDWREHELHGKLSQDEKGLIRYAREKYNIVNAVSIPMTLEEKGAAGASIISFKNDKEFKQLKAQNLETLIYMTRLFHDSNVSDLGKFSLPVFDSLSEPEIRVLNYKASGKPMQNIDDHAKIKAGYARNVLTTLRRKLGHINNDRLMYLFGLLNALQEISKKVEPEVPAKIEKRKPIQQAKTHDNQTIDRSAMDKVFKPYNSESKNKKTE